MEKNLFFNIHIEGETTEIGIVQIESREKASLNDVQAKMRYDIEEKVVLALKEHFSCEIKVVMSHLIKLNPLEFKVDVVVCDEEEDYLKSVRLRQTWVY